MAARALSCIVFVAVILLLPSCSQEKAIVGYWQWGDVQSFFEFRSDGVFQSYGEGASKVTGRYKFLSRDKLQIDIAGDSNPKIIFVSIKGDEMTLTEHKFDMKLRRVDVSAIQPEESVK